MGGVVFMCWCIFPAALLVPHMPSTRQQRIAPTPLPWWADCPTLSYKGYLHGDHVDANMYWAGAFLMVSKQSSAASPHSYFHFRNYTVVTDPRLLKGETCFFFWGPLYLSSVCSLFSFVLMAPELLKELFLLLEHSLVVHLIEVVVWCYVGLELISVYPRRQTSWTSVRHKGIKIREVVPFEASCNN